MIKKFIPKMYVKDIFSIDYNKLKDLGYKLIIFDLDNTIGSIKETKCRKETSLFLNSLMKDFKVIVASNSGKGRVSNFLKDVKCDYYYLSLKPTLRILRKVKKKYKIEYNKIVVVGDQIVTDIFFGNRKNVLTILVDPIKNIDFKVTTFNRKLERFINKKNNIKRGNYYEEK